MNNDPARKAELLGQLRQQLRRLEEPGRAAGRPGLPLWPGVAELTPAGLHELRPATPLDQGAALGLAALLLGRAAAQGPVVWVTLHGELYGPGLAGLDLPLARLLLVRVRSAGEALWALAESLAAPGLGGVVGEVGRIAPVDDRRLHLAVERGGAVGLLLRPPDATPVTTATSRWQVASRPGAGTPSWHLTLEHSRTSPPGSWEIGLAADGSLHPWGEAAARVAERVRLRA